MANPSHLENLCHIKQEESEKHFSEQKESSDYKSDLHMISDR